MLTIKRKKDSLGRDYYVDKKYGGRVSGEVYRAQFRPDGRQKKKKSFETVYDNFKEGEINLDQLDNFSNLLNEELRQQERKKKEVRERMQERLKPIAAYDLTNLFNLTVDKGYSYKFKEPGFLGFQNADPSLMLEKIDFAVSVAYNVVNEIKEDPEQYEMDEDEVLSPIPQVLVGEDEGLKKLWFDFSEVLGLSDLANEVYKEKYLQEKI